MKHCGSRETISPVKEYARNRTVTRIKTMQAGRFYYIQLIDNQIFKTMAFYLSIICISHA